MHSREAQAGSVRYDDDSRLKAGLKTVGEVNLQQSIRSGRFLRRYQLELRLRFLTQDRIGHTTARVATEAISVQPLPKDYLSSVAYLPVAGRGSYAPAKSRAATQ